MKERPILFKPEMVNAILDGRKTQTRRIFKKALFDGETWAASVHPDGSGKGWIAWTPNPTTAAETVRCYPGNEGFACPYGGVGDRLWVREPWQSKNIGGDVPLYEVIYTADSTRNIFSPAQVNDPRDGGHPSIHMPRAASRITLEIVKIRVERVQDITEEDAKAEGVWGIEEPYQGVGDLPTDRFRALWDKINGNWEADPWVWIVEFKRL